MNHSSRREPCPICGRDTNDYCRWNDDFVFCFQGTSFHPPEHLRLGQTIRLASGRSLALLSRSAGFSGQSALFGPDRPLEALLEASRDPAEYHARHRHETAKLKIMRRILRKINHSPPLEFLTLDKIRTTRAASVKIWEETIDVESRLRADRIAFPRWKQFICILRDTRKQAMWIAKNANSFLHYLGNGR